MSEPNQFKQTPGRALLAFAIVALLVAIFTIVVSKRRTQLEGYDFPTALGDQEFFPFGQNFEFSETVMTIGGRKLYRQRGQPLVRFDKYMFKAGRDDGDRCFLYRYGKPGSGDITPEGTYFAKIGDGSYIELAATPRPPRAELEDAPPGGGG